LKLGLDTWAICATIVAETTKAGSSKKNLKAGLDSLASRRCNMSAMTDAARTISKEQSAGSDAPTGLVTVNDAARELGWRRSAVISAAKRGGILELVRVPRGPKRGGLYVTRESLDKLKSVIAGGVPLARAAEILGVNAMTLRNWVRAGFMRGNRVHKKLWLVLSRDVEAAKNVFEKAVAFNATMKDFVRRKIADASEVVRGKPVVGLDPHEGIRWCIAAGVMRSQDEDSPFVLEVVRWAIRSQMEIRNYKPISREEAVKIAPTLISTNDLMYFRYAGRAESAAS
jgi:hypothetical protein